MKSLLIFSITISILLAGCRKEDCEIKKENPSYTNNSDSTFMPFLIGGGLNEKYFRIEVYVKDSNGEKVYASNYSDSITYITTLTCDPYRVFVPIQYSGDEEYANVDVFTGTDFKDLNQFCCGMGLYLKGPYEKEGDKYLLGNSLDPVLGPEYKANGGCLIDLGHHYTDFPPCTK